AWVLTHATPSVVWVETHTTKIHGLFAWSPIRVARPRAQHRPGREATRSRAIRVQLLLAHTIRPLTCCRRRSTSRAVRSNSDRTAVGLGRTHWARAEVTRRRRRTNQGNHHAQSPGSPDAPPARTSALDQAGGWPTRRLTAQWPSNFRLALKL